MCSQQRLWLFLVTANINFSLTLFQQNILVTLHLLIYFFLTITLQIRSYWYPNFIRIEMRQREIN